MIIWIASYPKSGNTWVKLFLSAYMGNHVDPKTFDINKMMIPIVIYKGLHHDPLNYFYQKIDCKEDKN